MGGRCPREVKGLRSWTTRVGLLLALPLIVASCSIQFLDLGVDDPDTRAALRTGRIVYASKEGLYIAHGDGSGAKKLLHPGKIGPQAAVYQPLLSPAGDRVLFLSMTGIDVRDSSGTDLTLNIVDLKGSKFEHWKRVRLEKILPPDEKGRQTVFDVAAAAWSRDGARIALGLNRDRSGRRDAVLVLDASGGPQVSYGLTGYGLPNVGSISWYPSGDGLVLGVQTGQDEHGFPDVSVARLFLEGNKAGELEVIGEGVDPSLSTGGDRIAVIDSQNGGWDIVLLDRDGEPVDRFLGPAGRALSRPFWSADDRYIYYHSLASTGPLGLIEVTVLRCLDTRGGQVFDLVRLR